MSDRIIAELIRMAGAVALLGMACGTLIYLVRRKGE
jgi:hypothetical protein